MDFIDTLNAIFAELEKQKNELHLTPKPQLTLYMSKEDFEWLMDNTCYGKLQQSEVIVE